MEADVKCKDANVIDSNQSIHVNNECDWRMSVEEFDNSGCMVNKN